MGRWWRRSLPRDLQSREHKPLALSAARPYLVVDQRGSFVYWCDGYLDEVVPEFLVGCR